MLPLYIMLLCITEKDMLLLTLISLDHECIVPRKPPHYAYEYAVNDDYAGTHFGHSEARDGYNTEGKYFVHLPDGRVQTVTYYADETGYHPTVSYEGTAHYDVHAAVPHHAPAKAYHAPEPSKVSHRQENSSSYYTYYDIS
ncbi:cuticle protein 7-like [Penaeus indicus]|uniref:cuticle protein 7-like n=1 Tax=Penaeus indicus TaxID=29960 RepID=UPI00300C5E51